MACDEGLEVIADYVTRALPSSRLMFREGPGRQQRASLTFQDATGRQFVFDVHETFYMRSAGLRERLDAWDIAGELRNGARTIRLDEESFHVVERYA